MITARKAQISWFIVLGIVFIALLGILSWIAYNSSLYTKPSQTLTSEETLNKVEEYLQSCEKTLAEEAFITIGNRGVEELPTLEEISREVSNYVDEKLEAECKAETVTKKQVIVSKPSTSIRFSDKETMINTGWEISLTIDNAQYSIKEIKIALPLRMKLVHETVETDLTSPGTDLNFVNSLDNMDLKKIRSEDKITNILIDHKSKINDKPYKFFYTENI